jgi:hypothetical protein
MSNPSVLDGSLSDSGNDSPFEGGGNRYGSRGDVPATARTAPSDRDIPPGLTALSPFQGGISRSSLMGYRDEHFPLAIFFNSKCQMKNEIWKMLRQDSSDL